MEFIKKTFSIAINPIFKQGNSMDVDGYVAAGTGLGYYTDAKPQEGVYPAFEVNGQTVFREHDETRYCPMHVASGMGFGLWFYQEEQARTFIERMASALDWIQALDVLKELPEWTPIIQRSWDIAKEIAQA